MPFVEMPAIPTAALLILNMHFVSLPLASMWLAKRDAALRSFVANVVSGQEPQGISNESYSFAAQTIPSQLIEEMGSACNVEYVVKSSIVRL